MFLKLAAAFIIVLGAGSLLFAQSGRRFSETKPAELSPAQQSISLTSLHPAAASVEKTPDYRCAKDGNHHRIFNADEVPNEVLSSKAVDRQAIFRAKPRPGYTLEARRHRKQGFVILKVALSATGTISRVRVLRGLPFGLTESAIKAACKLQFKPAIKDGQSVSQWVTAEYVFRLPDSRLFRP